MDQKQRGQQVQTLVEQMMAGSLEAFSDERDERYTWVERAQRASAEEKDHARSALKKLARREPLTGPELGSVEAIILPEGRPVVDIIDDSYTTPEAPWAHLGNATTKRLLEGVIPSIGRVEVPEHPSLPYVGTGFVVGEGLLMTNRHVAEVFVQGLGLRNLSFRAGLGRVEVDFKREITPSEATPLRVMGVVMIHPYWDMALLRVAGLEGRSALTLQAIDPRELVGNEIAAIGYPAFDPRNDSALQNRIFRGVFQIKRFQPGKITGRKRTSSFDHLVDAFGHDASTLGGNSGSAIVDVSSGQVVGLHFGGRYLVSNYAVPAFEMKRDPNILRAGVQFSNERVPANPTWMSVWDQTERRAPQPRPGNGGGSNGSGPRADASPAVSSGGGVVRLSVPLDITIAFGAPRLVPATYDDKRPTAPVVSSGTAPLSASGLGLDAIDADEARRRARRFDEALYFDADADAQASQSYYSEMDPDVPADDFFDALNKLLSDTHERRPSYAPTKHLYPVVDRQPDGTLRSLYSADGHSFSFEEILQLELAVEAVRTEKLNERVSEGPLDSNELEAIEAANPFNCEHVVPQSWFEKKEPMRGDLHHLFTCESGCNSFRGNRAYFQFREEAMRDDCGQSGSNQFEPGAGKGAVARATFYFLVRYPKLVGAAELPRERLETLLRWHREDPVSEWEQHRNQTIYAAQGNRNPFIDHAQWASKLSFARGLGGGKGRAPSGRERVLPITN